MRYVNHKFGRACVHRPRRGGRKKEEDESEGEAVREGTRERLRRDTSVRAEDQRGIRRGERAGGEREKKKKSWRV